MALLLLAADLLMQIKREREQVHWRNVLLPNVGSSSVSSTFATLFPIAATATASLCSQAHVLATLPPNMFHQTHYVPTPISGLSSHFPATNKLARKSDMNRNWYALEFALFVHLWTEAQKWHVIFTAEICSLYKCNWCKWVVARYCVFTFHFLRKWPFLITTTTTTTVNWIQEAQHWLFLRNIFCWLIGQSVDFFYFYWPVVFVSVCECVCVLTRLLSTTD